MTTMTTMTTGSPLKYLHGYPPALLAQVEGLLREGRLGANVAQRYPEAHTVRSDKALVAYATEIKARYLKSTPPLAQVAYDNRLHPMRNALGMHTAVSRVQGGNLKAKRELRVASLFKAAPAAFLRMIVVHELAHLREREHDKAFYALCLHMEADYHQLEFDTRLWLTAREWESPASLAVAVP